MRLFKITLLVASLIVFSAATSSAVRVDMSSPDFGSSVAPGTLVTVDVFLNTEGTSGITLLGVGMLFNSSSFTYRQDLSSTTTYLLYVSSKQPYLVAASTCGGSTGTGCNIFPTRPNQVQLDFLSSGLPNGAAGTTANTQLVSLVFEATGPGAGSFNFDFDPFFGSILQLANLTNPPLGLGAGGTITVIPEPTTALLVGLGLTGLAVAGRRNRA